MPQGPDDPGSGPLPQHALGRYVLFQREVICGAMRAQDYLSNHALNRFSEWKPGVAAFCTWIGHSWAANKQRDCLSAPNRGTRSR